LHQIKRFSVDKSNGFDEITAAIDPQASCYMAIKLVMLKNMSQMKN